MKEHRLEPKAQATPGFSDFGFISAKVESQTKPSTICSNDSSDPVSPRRGRSRTRSSVMRRSNRSSASQGRGKRGSFPWGMSRATDGSTPDIEESPPVSSRAADPPRPAKERFEWVWFPEGYWAEREIIDITPKKHPWFGACNSSSKAVLFSPRSHESDSSPARSHRAGKKKAFGDGGSSHTRSDFTAERSPALEDSGPNSVASLPSIRPLPEVKNPEIIIHEAEPRVSLFMRGLQLMSPSIHNPDHEGAIELGSFYSKTKSRLKIGSRGKRRTRQDNGLSPSTTSEELPSRTTMLLEGTSGYFDRAQTKKNQARRAASPATSSPDSKGSRRRFGLAPWHRRNSHDTLMSITSSLHTLLMGATPSATPIPRTEVKQARGVDMTDPQQCSFLTTEAHRINTPPLPQLTPTGHAHDFFFELPSPEEHDRYDSAPSHSSPRTPRVMSPGAYVIKRHRRSESPGSGDWFNSNISVSSRSHSPAGRTLDVQSEGSGFQLNVPEHPDNSPLCPANPFHKSGGTGICPYHGRRRKTTVESVESVDSVEILLRMT